MKDYDYSLSTCISILNDALTLPEGSDLSDIIERYQAQIWGKGFGDAADDPILAYLLALAADLDMYERNPDWRDENDSYYGENVALQKIRDALEFLSLAIHS